MTPFESLLGAAQAGAEWAWDRLYRDLAPSVRGYLLARGARDVDDLLGEVWLQLARNIGTFQGDERGFRSWVFVVAHHRLVDERRRLARRREDLVDDLSEAAVAEPSAEEAAGWRLEADAVLVLLSTLTDDQRAVIALRVLGDMTVEQVAEILGRRPGAVKALQRRAIRRLEKNLLEGVPLEGISSVTEA